jgi:methylamine--corrinoid protein Co-methyltransferase
MSQLNELKIDLDGLQMVAGWIMNGDIIMIEQMPILGGYAGGIEETAIVDVATHLITFTLCNGDFHLDGPVHVRWGITTAREPLTVAGHCNMAIDRNTHLLTSNQYYPLAQPCTEMCLLETAAQAITDTASGRELISGSAAAKGVALDYTTGMEARVMGEVAKAVAGRDIEKVNVVLDKLISLYEGNYRNPPQGKTFQQCYNVVKVVPTPEHLEVYGKAVETLEGLGLKFTF